MKFLKILLVLAMSISCLKVEEPLRIGSNVWPGYEGMFLARNQKYFTEKEVKLLEYPSASEVLRAFESKIIDAAALTMDESLLSFRRGNDLKVILIFDFSNGGDVLIAKPGIKKIEDLKGRRIGVETSALGAFFLSRIMEIAGIERDELTIVPVDVNNHESAFKNNQVDAVVTFEPVRSKLLRAGGIQIFDSSKIPYEILDVLVVRKSVLKTKKGQIKKFLNGYYKALEFWKENPDISAKIIAPREKLSPDEFKEALKGIYIPNKRENMKLLSGEDERFIKGIKTLNKTLNRLKLSEGEVVIKDSIERVD